MKPALLLLTLLSGCSHATFPAAVQPRALVWGTSQPNCLLVCIANLTVTDAESGSATSTVTSSETVSPSAAIGIGGGAKAKD